MSKALLYHYYVGKETLLFDILRDHLQALLDAVERRGPFTRTARAAYAVLSARCSKPIATPTTSTKSRSTRCRSCRRIAKTALIGMERELVAVFARSIAERLPAIGRSKDLLKPVTMSLFGMLNWHYMWFREGGAMTREAYADPCDARSLIEGRAGTGRADLSSKSGEELNPARSSLTQRMLAGSRPRMSGENGYTSS